jgi:hypothetical protein
MTWLTRALVIPSRREIAARDSTSPVSSCRCHSIARASAMTRGERSSAPDPKHLRDVRACAKSMTRQLEKFLLEEQLGSP